MNANCAKYWFLVCRFCAKYWCLLYRFCAEVLELCLLSLRQITGAWFVAIDCCCLSKLPVIVFSMYANVSCRCMLVIASEMPSCDWMCCVVYQLTAV